jgi:hypothetical protein
VRYFISFIILCFHGYFVGAQNNLLTNDTNHILINKKQNYLIAAVNFSEFAFKESMISPLVYHGTGIGWQLGFEKNKLHKITFINTNWSKAKLYNQLQAKQYFAALTHFNASIGTCYKTNKIPLPRCLNYLGWRVAQHSDFRRISQFQNASLSYNLSLSLAPVYLAKGKFSLKEKSKRILFKKGFNLDWCYQISVPLISGISRPNYNAIRLLKDGSGNAYQNSVASEVMQNINVYLINKFIAFDQQVEIQIALNKSNKMALQYKWHFESFTKHHFAYSSSQSGIYFCLYTQLNKF